MPKRKAPAVEEGRAAGKRKAEPDIIEPGSESNEDDLQAALLGLSDDVDVLAENDGVDDALELGDDVADESDDLEAEFLKGEESDLGEASEALVTEDDADALDDDVQLPFEASHLQSATELNFSDTRITVKQAKLIAAHLAENESLNVIHFDGHDLSISDLKEEDELEWDSEEFTDTEAIIIAELLKTKNTSCVRLDLARNQISNAGAKALAEMLLTNTTLEYLNLESNVVAESGGVAFVKALGQNSTLQYLNLSSNALPSGGVQELRDAWSNVRDSQLGLHL